MAIRHQGAQRLPAVALLPCASLQTSLKFLILPSLLAKGLLQKSDELMESHVLIKYQVLLTVFDLLILSEHQIIC